MHNAIASSNLTLNAINCASFSQLSFSGIDETLARNQSRWSAPLRILLPPPPHFECSHQALKMRDGSRIKAIPKCQASAMAASVAETKRLHTTVVVNICRCASSTTVGQPYQRPLLTPSPSLHLESRCAHPPRRIRTHRRDTTQSIDNTRAVVESSVNARPEDQTANLNRCLFFITPLISYATPPFYSEFRLDCREYTCVCMCVWVYPRACIRISPYPYRLVSLFAANS